MNRLLTRIALIGSGAMLGLIGGALMFTPKQFLELSHVFVERDPGLMSELTAPSGVLLITSALMIFGAVKLRLANLALSTGATVYGSYGVGRLISMALYGFPSESLIAATIIEFSISALLVALRLTAPSTDQPSIKYDVLGEAAL